MENFKNLSDYDLLAKIYVIKTEYGGRESGVLDGYRGQFFWHINNESCTDWDAVYIFENGSLEPGQEGLCKIILSVNVKKYSKGIFPINRQFCIREGSRVIAAGIILESKVQNV